MFEIEGFFYLKLVLLACLTDNCSVANIILLKYIVANFYSMCNANKKL